MRRSVLVTGAFGNVGSRIVGHLLAAGHRVVATDLSGLQTEEAAARFGKPLEVVWGNICDPAFWPRVLTGIDVVVHVAAIIPPAVDRNPKLAIAVNQTATLELVRHMESSPAAKRLIFASSMGVAGNEQHRRTPPLVAEEEPCAVDLYGKTKIECEERIRSSSLAWSILRLAVVVSPEFSSREAGNMDAMFEASATGRVEVVHNDDAGLAFANAVDCDEAIGKILFIGGGERCRSHVLDFYNRFFATMGLGPLKVTALRPGPPYFYGDWVDTAESQRLLAFQRYSLDEILASRKASVGFRRWLIRPVAPLVNAMIARRSPHLARSQ
ncbi:MAG: NAD(P)-dependent oxidoreductase [Sinimarinibacterium sp.]|jgi:nucleoside-diphosphate-sugar epimerase